MYLSSLALVGLLGSALAVMHNPHRKTMGFGPVHPHAKFHVHEVPVVVPGSSCKLDDGTTPISSSFFNSNPYEIARCFVTALLDDQLSEDNSFALRNDSYTDKATGVTHVFFRQMINGIEVADGDINVNVMDGRVISYGDSVSFVEPLPLAGRLLYLPSFTVAMCPTLLMNRSPPYLLPTLCRTR
jgi:extracellular elastinolytic metalloproteinase